MTEKKQENAKETVLDSKELVTYHNGSVVSRTVVYKPAGTITLFAFDTGEGLSEHTAPYDTIAVIIDGEAIITIAGREFHLATGQMIITPANVPHSLRALQRFKMMLTMIHA